jgi:hypothetical protein
MRSTLMSTQAKRLLAVGVAVVCAAGGGAAQAQSANATVTTLATFTTPGTYVWTVPTGVTKATFDVYGARGGSVLSSSGGIVNVVSVGGAGGEAKGRITVHGGEKFEIVVGGAGGAATLGHSNGAAGFNGGGLGDPVKFSGGGGGGSDVRIGGRGNPCAGGMTCSFTDRFIVGGGGGGGSWDRTGGYDGSAGGGVTGCCSTITISGTTYQSPSGGAQETGGICLGYTHGSFGIGGNGSSNGNLGGVGGAGGGWYGGCSIELSSGGGSGYISSLATSSSFHSGTNQGDGKVIITT